MITKIVLIRHGQTGWNADGRFQGQSDIELMPEGIEQAEQLADKFPLTKLDAIYCSDLKRTRRTAKAIADKFDLPVSPTEELREMNFGQWEGASFDEINKKWPDVMQKFFDDPDSVSIPDGETFLQVQDRSVRAIERIIKENPGNNVAVIAHGVVNRAILSHAIHIPLESVWAISQSNTAYNILTYDDEKGKFYIQTVNNVSHLLV